jgi:hypothetical protein
MPKLPQPNEPARTEIIAAKRGTQKKTGDEISPSAPLKTKRVALLPS